MRQQETLQQMRERHKREIKELQELQAKEREAEILNQHKLLIKAMETIMQEPIDNPLHALMDVLNNLVEQSTPLSNDFAGAVSLRNLTMEAVKFLDENT